MEGKRKRAMVGIGTLIVFIASILVAAIAAGLILRTQGTLQNSALAVGAQARKAVGSTFQTESIKLMKSGYDGTFDHLQMLVELGPGSDPAEFNKTYIDVLTDTTYTVLRYAGLNVTTYFSNKEKRVIEDAINSSNWTRLHSDLDLDYWEDSIRLANSTALAINLTGKGIAYIAIPSVASAPVNLSVNQTIAFNGTAYGRLLINGTVSAADTLPPGIVTVEPNITNINFGTYTVQFALVSPGKVRYDVIEPGDIVRINFETADALTEDEQVMVSIKKPGGFIERTLFVTPSFASDNLDVYP